MSDTLKAFRGDILHFLGDPAQMPSEKSYQYLEDGLMLVHNGRIEALGKAEEMLADLPAGTEVIHHTDGLIAPGFIDTHIHYPQTEMIGSYGEQLLEWLDTYTFPTETQFKDREYASQRAEFFLDQLLSNGTTTALVFGTVHPESVDAFFEHAQAKNLRMICGKVLMDRNAPEELTDCADSGYEQSKALIEKWHGRDRLQYAVTPRFAPTCSSEQMHRAAELLKEYPDVYMHTHLSENANEVVWVSELFPDSKHYLDAYDQHGLLGKRSVFAHGIHLCEDECQRLAESQSALSFCPTSNLFLGSGLFNLKQAEQYNIKVGLGTDVGAGTSFSILQTLNEAYKTQQLRGEKLTPLKSFYLATLGGARALDLDDKIGNFTVGKEADFVVLDYKATPLMDLRMQQCRDLMERLFVLSILGDDRAIRATYVMGEQAHQRDEK
ncbi:guanine deaminase [Pseudomaricurvus alkylphenolicus]|jgi:guanine deaminase|uniref:guanine deaminase n=1 Tax=Pseudomaricurvus alkylphenolicus TaxID=1306991 RepID=UPI001424003B|nr:guanine deaminase [Pseudomaricurvus alkylphenolicus]NIB40938.1 guanine deaminase [Pseudomaricurvus alkylphenolicus]